MVRVGLAVGLVSSALCAAHTGFAAEPRWTVTASEDACPSAELVRAALRPLVGDAANAESAASETLAPVDVEIGDYGDHYRVRVGDAERTVPDPDRDCAERARVAAVFAALNLPARKRTDAPPKPAPEIVSPAAPLPAPATRHALGATFEWSRALDGPGGSPGASLVWSASRQRARISLQCVGFAPTNVARAERARAGERVELSRLGLRLNAEWLWSLGDWRLGPGVGIGGEGLWMRVFGVPANAPQFRATPTLALNFAVRKQLGQRWSLGLGPALSAALASYELRVDPARGLGSLPNLWLTGSVGLERTLL